VLAAALMVASVWFWVDLNEELAPTCALAPPAADGAHLALGASACFGPAGGGPERLRPQLPWGQLIVPSARLAGGTRGLHLLGPDSRLLYSGQSLTATLNVASVHAPMWLWWPIAVGLPQWLLCASPQGRWLWRILMQAIWLASSKR